MKTEKDTKNQLHKLARAKRERTGGEMGKQDFEEVIYGRKRKKAKSKQERKKAWIYLGRMTQDTTIGVRISLIRKGIKGHCRRTENDGAI